MEAASPQIRNMATIGGNICQRPRCWYFRNGLGLLAKDPSGKDLVADGENRYHAILGNDGPAKFVSPSTVVPILIAYGAKIRLEGPQGKRELPLEKFFTIPKTEDEREHDLHSDEIVTELVLPSATNVKAAHYEIRQKEAFDWPLAVAAVALKMNGSNAQSVRVVLGYVAPTPDRKSTRLNSSHSQISYAVFCLKKKNTQTYKTSSFDNDSTLLECAPSCRNLTILLHTPH